MSARNPANPPSRARDIVAWTLQLLLAVAFMVAGGAKLAGVEKMVQAFEIIGLGQGFRIFTGVNEVAAALGLLFPRVAGVAALSLAATMVGAAAVHLLILPGSTVPALILLALCLVVAWLRREPLIALAERLPGLPMRRRN